MIDVRLVPDHNRNTLPGNTHRYDGNKIVGADAFRVDMTVIIPGTPGELRDAFESNLLPEHRTPGEPYGLLLLSSQLLDVTYLTTPALVAAYRDKPFQPPQATIYGGWPTGLASTWDGVLPATTWFPNGVGILDQYDGIDGARVTVYEYTVDKAQTFNRLAEPSGERVNMVTYHCDRCHRPSPVDLGERWENHGPDDRRWASRKARYHARGRDERCEIPDGKMERAVAAALSNMQGRTVEVPEPASACAAEEGCAQVRAARTATRLLTAA